MSKERFGKTGIGFKVYVNDEEVFKVGGVDPSYDYVEIGINSASVPAVSDVRTIVNAFFENMNEVVNVNDSFGFIELFISDWMFRDEVDTETLSLALPFGALERIAA